MSLLLNCTTLILQSGLVKPFGFLHFKFKNVLILSKGFAANIVLSFALCADVKISVNINAFDKSD